MSDKQVSVKQAGDVDHTNAYTVTVTEYGLTDQHIAWTGSDGQGLWVDGQQVAGRAQFRAGSNPSAAMRRYFAGSGYSGPGRPRIDAGAPTLRTTIRLTQAQVAKAEALGGGNVGAGVRLALEQA